jgi:peptide/nickel transport system permease protein
MLAYIIRRVITAVFIVIGASFVVYILLTFAGDPLEFTLNIQDPQERAATQRIIREGLSLDVHPVARFFVWFGDVIRGDFGISARTQLPVSNELARRLPLTLKLVTASTVLSIVIGISIGIVTALKQYSGFDYVVTFFTFVFFSLPVFWVAVILKSFGGIDFNDWLRDGATFPTWLIVVGALAAGGLGYSVTGGLPRRKAPFGIGAGLVVGALLVYISRSGWMLDPGLGILGIAVFSLAIAAGTVAVMAGWRNEKARNTALTVAAIGVLGWFPLQAVFDAEAMNLWLLLGLGVAAVLVGVIVGYAFGGYDKGLSARTGAITAFLIGCVVFVDRAMQSWADYSASSVIRNRPIKTIGDREYRLEGDFWIITNNTFSHLILPTVVLMLISLASYTRYSRASMLEVLNQDYIRTARSKGLTERTVIVRHGFRNALIPLATIVAFDIGGILGGAVITETVFEWNAMGRMFIDGLRATDPNPVMAFFLVIAIFAIMANLLADLAYAALDPRIRIGE